jgi:alkanesulfonate monooxygenase SsuD/methylene tetrahydromethanopterin reductase-like flavin-dependent oxidoreductase (luciferase family)
MTISTESAPDVSAGSEPAVISSLSLLVPGSFSDSDPYQGLESTLRLFEYAERLGLDGAWIRQQHLVPNVSSAPVFLAAASQRTRRIELGSAVIPIGYESPFRLAEDLSMADVLSRGRLQVGFSAGVPTNSELLAGLVYDGDWRSYDFSHARIARLAANLRGEFLGDEDTLVPHPAGPQRPRLRPHADGLARRLWYGAGSLGSVTWAAEHGLNLVVGNICAGQGLDTDDFGTAQLAQIRAYRQQFADSPSRTGGCLPASGAPAPDHPRSPPFPPGPGRPRVVAGRVIVPLDSADAAARRKYRDYQAARHQRTLAPIGERRILIAPDLVGTAAEIVAALRADPVLAEVTELQLELPYAFAQDEYEQILSDVATSIAPQLGWSARDSPERQSLK